MGRDRNEGHRKHPKDRHRKEASDRPAAHDGDSDRKERSPASGKSLKTYGIRRDEAQRQIQEMRSRY
jgi:hypothetical protein